MPSADAPCRARCIEPAGIGPRLTPPTAPTERPGLWLRLLSIHHAYWLWLSNRLRWRRGNYRERPAGVIEGLEPSQRQRIETLKEKYGVAFERQFDRSNTLENYTYLDLLDQFRQPGDQPWPDGRDVLDLGSKNFYYAPVLHAAFRPRRLTGLEVEGFRLYPNLYSRYDYAESYIRGLPDTEFVVGDARSYSQQAELITCFYPFVFPDVHVAWYLPLHLFDPKAYFGNVARLLRMNAYLIMVNQGREEFAQAAALCEGSGLRRLRHMEITRPLTTRRLPPQVSMWVRHSPE